MPWPASRRPSHLLGQSCEDQDVVAVALGRGVELSAASDESQRTQACGAVDFVGGKMIFGMLFDAVDDKGMGGVVRGCDQHGLVWNELVESKEHGGPMIAVNVTDDNCGSWLSWLGCPCVPPR